MDTNRLIESLMCFGLTRQEATIYLCLSQNGGLTGYECAKQTGISRSNAYTALAGLVDKGAAYTAEGTAVRYHMVDVKEFCSNKIRALEEKKEQIKASMPGPKEEVWGYLTVSGDTHIRDKVKNMISGAKERMYLSMNAEYVALFEKELAKAIKENKKAVILTDRPLEHLEALTYLTEDKKTQIGVITDSAYVLTGEFGRGEASACLYTGQPNFVRVFKDSMRNEIKLIQLLKGEK
ncbi:MAG: TrmB family transcriptional regulator [Eubacterium sp.]|nr:TrmB family transcriptional regulator [Eubacterium sp.]